MKKFFPSAFFAALAIMTVIPVTVLATVPGETTYETAYVQCGTKDVATYKIVNGVNTKTADVKDGIVDNPCGFSDVFVLARGIITAWIMAGVTIGTMGFAYAGLLYITAMGSQEKISHAHSIFYKVFLGFVVMLSAWLIAKAMETVFLTPRMQEKSFLFTPTEPAVVGPPPGGATVPPAQ
ncbi:MAG: hypothetical protein Q7R93_01545 [bacterium]|nr:hypothetical protein [bacterium]